ncbi:MAG TPA: DUF6055 domain-containing protein [Kofleriaceae bacterium]|nr:DUF6055 domain-containing protein [Kofleriaceae bacterium]
MTRLLLALALALALTAVPTSARAARDVRCGTHVAVAHRGPVRVLAERGAGERKVMRDAFGPAPHARRSANFALKWGDQGGPVDRDAVAAILEMLETAWQQEIESMGLPLPVGADAALFNVYLYGTGLAVPDFGFSAYTGIDDEGYPYVVLPPDLDLANAEAVDLMQITTAHELFHAIQMGTGAYDAAAGSHGYWYWEATADWMSLQVWPDSPVARDYVPFYLLAPHVGIESVEFPDPDGFSPLQLHHYGASILPVYLSDHVADRTLVLESWTTAAPADEPLAVLGGLLADRGLDMDEVFADFAAKNALLDYPDRALIEESTEKLLAVYPDYDRRIAARLSAADGELVAAPAATLPQAWAYNVIEIERPADLDISIEPEELGSAGTPARLVSRLLAGDDIARLVVVSRPDRTIPGETFPYRIALTPPPAETEPPTAEDDGGCSAAGGAASHLSVATLLVALLLARRSRQRRSCQRARALR